MTSIHLKHSLDHNQPNIQNINCAIIQFPPPSTYNCKHTQTVDFARNNFSNHFSNPTLFKTNSKIASRSSHGPHQFFKSISSTELAMSQYTHNKSTSFKHPVSSSVEFGLATPDPRYPLTPTSPTIMGNSHPSQDAYYCTTSSTPKLVCNDPSIFSNESVILSDGVKSTATEENTIPLPAMILHPPKRMHLSSNYILNVSHMVCLFWFNEYSALETAFQLSKNMNFAKESTTGNADPSVLASLTFSKQTSPTNSFKLFIRNIIRRTQLPPTVVSLALNYIIRLKQQLSKPITANTNSEYLVFSVALMLANKFLDDTTYSNATWAKLTHLPLREITAMEIEFLTKLKYRLHVNPEEWSSWQQQLHTWLNIHSSICFTSPNEMPKGAAKHSVSANAPQKFSEVYPAAAAECLSHSQSNLTQVQLDPNNTNTHNSNNKKRQLDHEELSTAKRPALTIIATASGLPLHITSPSFPQGHFVTINGLGTLPNAPVYSATILPAPAIPVASATASTPDRNRNTSSQSFSLLIYGAATYQHQQQYFNGDDDANHLRYCQDTLKSQKHKVNPYPQCDLPLHNRLQYMVAKVSI